MWYSISESRSEFKDARHLSLFLAAARVRLRDRDRNIKLSTFNALIRFDRDSPDRFPTEKSSLVDRRPSIHRRNSYICDYCTSQNHHASSYFSTLWGTNEINRYMYNGLHYQFLFLASAANSSINIPWSKFSNHDVNNEMKYFLTW